MNLAKGRVGEDNSALLGAMLITKIQMAAMSRVDTPEEDREDFYLYVDEFQNFATESFANILSEARKYRLNLIIAHQYVEQLDETVSAAVFGNVGTIILFRIGATDAVDLVKEFEPLFTEEDLVNLGKYDVYMKLMIDGIASQPFSATTLPPIKGETQNRDTVIKVSRERYATSRETVEDKIIRWSEAASRDSEDMENRASFRGREQGGFRDQGRPLPAPRSYQDRPPRQAVPAADRDRDRALVRDSRPPAVSRDTQERHSEEESFAVACDICGEETKLTFKPDGKRPVYCKSCLKKVRSGELPRLEAKQDARRDRRRDDGGSSAPAAPQQKVSIPGSAQIPTGDTVSLADALSQGIQKFKN